MIKKLSKITNPNPMQASPALNPGPKRKPIYKGFLAVALCFMFCIMCSNGWAKAANEEKLEAVIIYKVMQLTQWPNEQQFNTLKIGTYGTSSSYISTLKEYYKNQQIRGKSIDVFKFNPYKDNKHIHALLIDEKKVGELIKISSTLKGRHILIFTEQSKDKRYVMVNLPKIQNEKFGFEINRPNIILEGINISKDVVLAGGSELDVAKIYKETISDLTKTKEIMTLKDKKLNELSQRIESQQKKLKEQNTELEKQNKKMKKQNIEIVLKSKELVKLEFNLETQIKIIKQSNDILDDIEDKLKLSKSSLENQETKNLTLAEKIESNTRILESQKESLLIKDQEIHEKKIALNITNKTVSEQESTIKTQQRFLSALVIQVILVIILGVVLYRSYDAKKKSSLLIERKNTQLEKTMDDLKITQRQLIESEKMASLGGMVKGIAHEVNTPAGIVLTAISNLQERTAKLKVHFNKGTITKNNFKDFLDDCEDISDLSLKNIQRVADLVHNFKLVAVDQDSNEKRIFVLSEYLDDVIKTFEPLINDCEHKIEVNIQDEIEIFGYPGVLSQVIGILISNSLTHAFGNTIKGIMTLRFSLQQDNLHFIYQDNGKGADQNTIDNIFEPFYTTQRGTGGTGLGAHILYNLVTQLLMGEIRCTQGKESGLVFEIIIPIETPE